MNGFLIRVWGPYACFTRPEMRTERVSYDVMTPSAARGIMEAIYWHPGVNWVIDRIYVRKPIRMVPVRRNELKSVFMSNNLKRALLDGGIFPHLYADGDRTQRAGLILKDVEYFIESHFELSTNVLTVDKVTNIVEKRLANGRCYQRPCFGCREFPASFEVCDCVSPCPEELYGHRDLGWMLGDMDYTKSDPEPLFFRADMIDGCIMVPKGVRKW